MRNYEIEGLVKGKWKVLTKGESVGHKRITQIEDVEVSRVRIKVLIADREPRNGASAIAGTQNFPFGSPSFNN